MEWERLIYFWRVQWRRQRQIDISLPTRRSKGVPLLFQFHFYLRINFLLVIVPRESSLSRALWIAQLFHGSRADPREFQRHSAPPKHDWFDSLWFNSRSGFNLTRLLKYDFTKNNGRLNVLIVKKCPRCQTRVSLCKGTRVLIHWQHIYDLPETEIMVSINFMWLNIHRLKWQWVIILKVCDH